MYRRSSPDQNMYGYETTHSQSPRRSRAESNEGIGMQGYGPSKRQRVALACTRCRLKKSRCDGAQPICTLCNDMGYECVYQPPVTSKRPAILRSSEWRLKDRMREMEDRMKAMEETVAQSSQESGNHTPKSLVSGRQISNDAEYLPESDHADTTCEQTSVLVDYDTAQSFGNVDTMGVIEFADQSESGFFGPSSNITFMRHISNAIVATRDPDFVNALGRPDGNAAIVNMSRSKCPDQKGIFPSTLESHTGDKHLLQSSETLTLIQAYFSHSGLLFPYVHEETFLAEYQQVEKNNFQKVRMSWLALLYMILATAICTTTDDQVAAEERTAAAEIYYQKARVLKRRQNIQSTDLNMVQYLLLMVHYLQGTQRSAQTLALHGQVIQATYQLGLHSSNTLQKLPPVEAERRKRTWYACVLVDRTLSMTFGRPSGIPDDYVKLELPKELVNEDTDALQPFSSASGSLLSAQFFVATINLYKVVWAILDSLYNQNMGCNVEQKASNVICRILKLEQDLKDWRMALPDTLSVRETGDVFTIHQDDVVHRRMRTILSLRYYNVRNLLHRPILIQFLGFCGNHQRENGEELLYKHIGWSSVQMALESSREIISLVHETGGRRVLSGAWWFSLYYTFNSALVICSILLISSEQLIAANYDLKDLSQMRTYLSMAITSLHNLDPGNPVVDRCRQYLVRLIDIGLPKLPMSNCSVQKPPYHAFMDGPGPYTSVQPDEPWMSARLQDYWPLDFEMNEFMADDNIELFNHLLGSTSQQ